ncbi:hypothetical protein tb265_01200 [Gemmatimonadetes bacterium T265]|nr:hypothetical protein tb265_01200 [Gemmatimonadetes bacterium T265]
MRLPWNDTVNAPERRRADDERDRRGGGGGRRRIDWERAAEAGPTFGRIPAGLLLSAGFAGGLAVGAAVWDRLIAGSRRGLFSPQPMGRYHALSYLAARPSVDTARLLRDYLRWETHPLLRRRARRVLRAVEASL